MVLVGRGPATWTAIAAVIFAALLFAQAGEAGSDPAAAAKKGKTKKYNGPKIETPNAGRCDFLDTSVCLHPFPNNMYLNRDKRTASGWRVDLNEKSMPANVDGKPFEPTDHNRNDGFSPGQAIILHIKGLETQKAFDRSGIVPIDDPSDYRRKKQPVVVINAKTKKRHPIFAEVDANPESRSDRNLIIRPLKNWEEGQRYIVALRKLRKGNGKEIKPPKAFKVYRDKLITNQKKVENRRGYFERKIFKKVNKTENLGRRGLYMAWDFSVASGDSLSERVLAMRDDAFSKLGDNNLADGIVQGAAPKFTVDEVIDDPEPETLRRIKGTIDDVPCYLNQNGCEPGTQFAYDSKKAMMPTFNPAFRTDVPFECNIPNSIVDGTKVDPSRPALYGHGLLGNRSQSGSSYVREFGEAHNLTHCAVDWAGFSNADIGPVILPALGDLNQLSKAFDRMQQGFVNFLMLGRTLIHPSGLITDPAFSYDAGSGSTPVINTKELYYYGNSQGGIMGGALTAISPDFTQSVLGVPGMNYSTLLRRSVDFDAYAEIPAVGLYAKYPNELERPLLLGLMQMLWDRGEANGYAHHITDDPYANTPEHSVLLHAAMGDHQVANLTAENMARTVGAKVMEPALEPGRHWQKNPFFKIGAIGGYPFADSALVYFDGGPPSFNGDRGLGSGVPPNENVPPREENGFGEDPHGYPRRAPDAQKQMSDWLMPNGTGGLQGTCTSGDPCYSNGWTGP